MAFEKAAYALLKALSNPSYDVKKAYKLERRIKNVSSGRFVKLFYKPWDHTVSCGDHSVPVRIFSPETPGEHKILLFFHGGGWVTGNIDSYDRVCTHMARLTDHMVVSVDYRLAPEHRFPAAPEDCYAVARELFLDAELLGVPPEDITLIGDSAGGNLAAVVSLMARDRGEFLPRKQILLYPSTANDHHPETSPYASIRENGTDFILTSKRINDYMELYSSSPDDKHNPYFAPLEAEDLTRQPDTLIIVAEFDPLRDEGIAYGRRLGDAGNRVMMMHVPDALHGFISMPARFEAVKKTYETINLFLGGRHTAK